MKSMHKYSILVVSVILSSLMVNVLAQETLPTNLNPIYSAEDTHPLMRLGHGWANDIAWSLDGATLAVATSTGVWLYDVSDLQAEPVLVNETVFDVRIVAYSSDGRFLAAGGSEVHIWNANTHELIRSLNASGSVIGLAFSPDSSQLVISHGFGATVHSVEVWVIETAHQLAMLSDGVFADLVFSTDGTYIAGIRLSDCCFRTYLWDATTGTTLFSGDVEVRADDERIVFSPDGETIVAVDRTGSFTVLDSQMQTMITTVTLDTESDEWYPAEVAFTPDGKLLLTLSNLGMLRIWETDLYDAMTTIDLNWNPYKARLNPDGTQIAAIDRIGNLAVWDSATGELVAQRDNFVANDTVITFNPEGTLLASGATKGEIWLWDVATGEPLFVLAGHEDEILTLDFSSDGAFLASASRDGTVRLWDMAGHNLSRIIADREHVFNTVIIDSQNQILIADDNLIQIYDLATGEPILWFSDNETNTPSSEFEMETRITDITFEGRSLAVATINGQIDYWNSNGRLDVTRGLRHLSINVLTSFDDYSVMYAGANNVVLRWDDAGTQILTTHNSWIYALASNYQVLASGGCAETKRSPWDGSPYCDGADLRLWTFMPEFFTIVSQEHGHTAPIRDIAFNSDGTLLATVGDDGTILLWGNPTSDE